MRILTTMFCFAGIGEEERSVFGGVVRGGLIVAVMYVCVVVGKGGGKGGGCGVNACQPDRASSVQQGQLGVSARL